MQFPTNDTSHQAFLSLFSDSPRRTQILAVSRHLTRNTVKRCLNGQVIFIITQTFGLTADGFLNAIHGVPCGKHPPQALVGAETRGHGDGERREYGQ
jgi:hypothetical protein